MKLWLKIATISISIILILIFYHATTTYLNNSEFYDEPVTCSASASPGRTFHVDPRHGRIDGDGSALKPWKQLQDIVDAGLVSRERRGASLFERFLARMGWNHISSKTRKNPHAIIADGDTIILHGGDYNDVDLSGLVNREFITIMAAAGESPRITSLTLNSASHFILRGLSVEGRLLEKKHAYLVTVQALPQTAAADNILLEDVRIGSDKTISTVPRDYWASSAASGAILTGDCLEIRKSQIHDVRSGIVLYRVSRTRLISNEVSGFSVDGFDFSGNDIEIRNNKIQDHWSTGDSFHPDCMQGQSGPGQPRYGPVLIQHNICIARVTPRFDPTEYLQGLSIFDGTWRNITIRCNLVISTAPHGIALYGIDDATITGNVVLGRLPRHVVWIVSFPSKPPESRAPTRNVIRGNIATGYLNAALGGPTSVREALTALGVNQDAAIVEQMTRGFSGVVLAENRLARDRDAYLRQSPDPRLRPLDLDAPIEPMTAAQALARFPLPSGCDARRPA